MRAVILLCALTFHLCALAKGDFGSYDLAAIREQTFKEVPNENLGENFNIIAEVTEDRFPTEVILLILVTDQNGDPTHFLGFDTFNHRISRVDLEGPLDARDNKQLWRASDMNLGADVTKMDGRNIITLTALDPLDRDRASKIRMDYLYKGKLLGEGDYKQHEFVLINHQGWRLYLNRKTLIRRMHMEINRNFLGIIVGIKKVIFNVSSKFGPWRYF